MPDRLSPSRLILVFTLFMAVACTPDRQRIVQLGVTEAGTGQMTVRVDGETWFVVRASDRQNGSGSFSGPLTLYPGDTNPDGVGAVSRVLVKRPWYAADWMIRRGFRRSLSEFRAVPGLIQKIYLLEADQGYGRNRFGGLYFWADRQAAERFYDETWANRIADTYGEPADLLYLKVVSS